MQYLCNVFIFTLIFSISPQHASCHEPQEITLIFVSQMAEIQPGHNRGGGLARLATLLQKKRADKEHVLFVHGGASLSPSILSSFDQGAHMISLLNLLEPDVMAVSKSDLAHKEDELTLRTFEASFPFINSNLTDPLTTSGNIEGTMPFILLDVGRFTLGFMSLIDPDVITDYMPKRVKLVDSTAAILETAKALRVGGADLIILLADYLPNTIERWLDSKIIDIALISAPRLTPQPEQNAHNYYEFNTESSIACVLTLTLMENIPVEWTGKTRTVSLADFSEDPGIAKNIQVEIDHLAKILNTTIGKTLTPIDTRRASVRTGENGFANFIADTLREFYASDFALINGGGIRGNRQYPSGTILTRGDMHRELPFNNRITNIRLTGRQMLLCLENGLSKILEENGRFPHISGMRVTYNPGNPPNRRVANVFVAGKIIDLNKTYTLATLDYLAEGGDGYGFLKDCERLVKIGGGKLLLDYVKKSIVEKKTISPVIDGRFTALTN